MRVLFVLIALSLALSGCASLSEDDCEIGDWQGIGVVDGKAGRTSDKLNDHTKACSKYGVSPDVNAYLSGRNIGLQSYCTPISGFEQGRDGKSYHGVCPIISEESFKLGYSLGGQLYTAKEALKEARSEIRNIHYRISKFEDISEKECKSGIEGKSCRKDAKEARSDVYHAHAGLLLAQTRLFTVEQQYNRVRRDVTARLLDLEPGYTARF